MARRADVQYVRFFTDGSAAAQVAPLIREDPYYVPRTRKRRKKLVYVDPVALFGILISVALAISMVMGAYQLNLAKQENAQMEQYITSLEQENAKLTEEYHNSYNLDMIGKTAEAMGMVPADQVPKVVLEMETPVQEIIPEEPSVWDEINMFLTGLFA